MSARALCFQIGAALLLSLGGLWAATQWAAAMLAYQPALGAPLAEAFGCALYAPWKLFGWWLAFDRQAPHVFNTAGLMAAAGGVASGAVALGGAAWRSRTKARSATFGSARWAAISDLRNAGLLEAKGIVLGSYDGHYLRHDGPEHVLTVAPTRSGKGVGLVLPTLLTWRGSAIVHDIKGENWTETAGWRSTFSQCLRFDPTDPDCARFNPLDEVRKGVNEVRDVQNIADILVDPEGAQPIRNHWQLTSYSLLVGAILHVLYAEKDKTLTGVARFLSEPSRSLARTLKIMMTTNHLGTQAGAIVHPTVAEHAREVWNKTDNERSGVLSTALTYLSLYRDPIVAANTACSDWRIADLMAPDRPVSLYLVVPPSDISRTRPLMRLILNQIGRRMTERLPHPGEAPPRVLMMLDEFPALGRLDFFETSLAFLAGYGVRVFLVAQSLNQIDKAYGQNNAILDNCHVRVAFAPNDERTAKRLSDALGTATELRAQRNLSGARLSMWLSHTSIAEQESPRALMTPGEVLQLDPRDALVMIAGVPPIRARKIQHYRDLNFTTRRLPVPAGNGRRPETRPAPATWPDLVRSTDAELERQWDRQMSNSPDPASETRELVKHVTRSRQPKRERAMSVQGLPLFDDPVIESPDEPPDTPLDDPDDVPL